MFTNDKFLPVWQESYVLNQLFPSSTAIANALLSHDPPKQPWKETLAPSSNVGVSGVRNIGLQRHHRPPWPLHLASPASANASGYIICAQQKRRLLLISDLLPYPRSFFPQTMASTSSCMHSMLPC